MSGPMCSHTKYNASTHFRMIYIVCKGVKVDIQIIATKNTTVSHIHALDTNRPTLLHCDAARAMMLKLTSSGSSCMYRLHTWMASYTPSKGMHTQ